MRLVELVAPAAAGKSVLTRGLLAAHRPRGRRRRWVDARRLIRPARVPGGSGLARLLPERAWADRARDLLLGAPGEDAIARALVSVAEGWADFLTLVVDPVTVDDAGADARATVLALQSRRWFHEALEQRALIETHRRPDVADPSGDTLALLDEGLLHPYKIEAGVGRGTVRQERYLATAPLPDVVLSIAVPDAILVERLERLAIERPDRLRLAMLRIDDPDAIAAEVARGQALVARTLEEIRSRGGVVHIIDGSAPFAAQVEEAMLALEERRS